MSDAKCDFCNKLLIDGQKITFSAVAEYKALKSRIHYAISAPKEVLSKRCFPECYGNGADSNEKTD